MLSGNASLALTSSSNKGPSPKEFIMHRGRFRGVGGGFYCLFGIISLAQAQRIDFLSFAAQCTKHFMLNYF